MRELFTKYTQWRDALNEAMRRDAAEGQKLRDQGYRQEGNWVTPEGSPMFDGPGSHVSVLHHLEAVIKERGLEDDLEQLGGFLRRIRREK